MKLTFFASSVFQPMLVDSLDSFKFESPKKSVAEKITENQ